MENIYLAIPLAPLVAAVLGGLFGRKLGRTLTAMLAIGAVALSFILSAYVLKRFVFDAEAVYNQALYTWAQVGHLHLQIGFMVDRLTALMLCVVTFVSLMVHVYTVGYMRDDAGFQRFFAYIALFTFSMLMLVMANNFLQLFFGWEAVGLVSYLLIGFWYTRPSALYANLKAFLVNRVGDFGFLLGIAAIYMLVGSLDYTDTFAHADELARTSLEILPGTAWSAITVICILLFIGAMGKSAQMPLHVWLPDSMEGPTPISALIHAATMVTAGIFMVTRMSPLFEQSDTALTVVLVIGSLTAFLMGLVGIVQQDIKRVIAYSTLSQLGYMTAGLGASAYSLSMFHLMTHAFFKALLFLGAGSVIMALHHEQDIRRMGGLRKHMPVTYWTFLIGTLALVGFPGFSGFYSKDSLIEVLALSHGPGATLAYWALLGGVFVTSLYSFRLMFVVFHGESRVDHHTAEHLHESPWVVTVPLMLLALPSIWSGYSVGSVALGHFFKDAVHVAGQHAAVHELSQEFHGILAYTLHGFLSPPFWLMAAGLVSAWYLYLYNPALPQRLMSTLSPLHSLLMNKYGFDAFNERVFMGGGQALAGLLWKQGDVRVIDGWMVNGLAHMVEWFSRVFRRMQTGYLYHYAFAMILGLLLLLARMWGAS